MVLLYFLLVLQLFHWSWTKDQQVTQSLSQERQREKTFQWSWKPYLICMGPSLPVRGMGDCPRFRPRLLRKLDGLGVVGGGVASPRPFIPGNGGVRCGGRMPGDCWLLAAAREFSCWLAWFSRPLMSLSWGVGLRTAEPLLPRDTDVNRLARAAVGRETQPWLSQAFLTLNTISWNVCQTILAPSTYSFKCSCVLRN